MRLLAVFLLVLLGTSGASAQALPVGASGPMPPEHRARPIALAGPLASRDAEISGMAWHGDALVLLPQYPGRFAVGEDTVRVEETHRAAGAVFVLARAEIEAYLEVEAPEPLRPRAVPFASGGVAGRVPGFEGFEAIAFEGDRAFLTIESDSRADVQGHLVAGAFGPDGLRLDAATLTPIPAQTRIANLSYEALLIGAGGVLALQEANGAAVNPEARAYVFDSALALRDSLRVPALEYRLTDATAPDPDGRFWAVNYFFPGDEPVLRPAADSLALAHGLGWTHRRHRAVERLVELRHDGGRIVRTRRPPIQLELLGDDRPRNWEALARLGTRGFLVATDTYPETILAFVPAAPPFDTTD